MSVTLHALDGVALSRFLEQCPPDTEAGSDYRSSDTQEAVHDYRPWGEAQRAFHESDAKYRWLRGGLGSGKSRGGFEELRIHLTMPGRLGSHPCVALVGAQTYRHLMDNTIPVLKRAFHPRFLRGGDWDKAFRPQQMLLHLFNGSTIALRSAHNGKYHDWRGPEFACYTSDEGRNFRDREPWKTAISRLRYPGVPPKHLRAWNMSTTNGHDWEYDEFHGSRKTDKHADFLLLTKDNPHLPDGYYEDLLASMDEDDARQELEGAFLSRQGAVYSRISKAQYPDGNLIDMAPDPYMPTDVQIDWGYRHPRVHFVQQSRQLTADGQRVTVDVVVREWALANGRPPADRTVGDMIEWLLEQKRDGWNIRRIFCDPAGDSANDQEHITSVQQVWQAVGVRPVYPKAPWQRSIVNGERVVRSRVRDSNGQRWLLWASHRGESLAPNSLEAMSGLMFPEAKKRGAVREQSEKDGVNDHDTDAIRYRCVMLYGRDGGAREGVQVVGI